VCLPSVLHYGSLGPSPFNVYVCMHDRVLSSTRKALTWLLKYWSLSRARHCSAGISSPYLVCSVAEGLQKLCTIIPVAMMLSIPTYCAKFKLIMVNKLWRLIPRCVVLFVPLVVYSCAAASVITGCSFHSQQSLHICLASTASKTGCQLATL
jgi:hypothetical protein